MTEAALEKHYTSVFGKRMTFTEVGDGGPIVFLQGNPTSSYLWRNIIPHLSGVARCVAPDLVGMGDSEPVTGSGPERYRFVEHREFLDVLLDQLVGDDRVTLVLHDLGSALGFDWERRHSERIEGIAYMEAIVRPLTWDDWPHVLAPSSKPCVLQPGRVSSSREHLHREVPACLDRAGPHRRRVRCISGAIEGRRGEPETHPHLGERDPDRG